MEISVVPLGLGHPSVGDHIAAVVKYLERQRFPTNSQIWGPWSTATRPLLQVAAALHELPFQRGVLRVMTHISLDDRRDQEVFLGDKKNSVKARLK